MPPDSRLSLPFPYRLPLCVAASSLSGMALGMAHGSNEAGFRFRAENAHRLPKSQTGWYLYHKSKNHHMALGGVKEGFRMAARVSAWAALFLGMEEGVDCARRGMHRIRKGRDVNEAVAGDFVSSMLAGLSTGGAFSLWNRFPIVTAARVARMGAKGGLLFGLLQDGVSLMRGRRVSYVEFIKRHTIGSSSTIEQTNSAPGLVG